MLGREEDVDDSSATSPPLPSPRLSPGPQSHEEDEEASKADAPEVVMPAPRRTGDVSAIPPLPPPPTADACRLPPLSPRVLPAAAAGSPRPFLPRARDSPLASPRDRPATPSPRCLRRDHDGPLSTPVGDLAGPPPPVLSPRAAHSPPEVREGSVGPMPSPRTAADEHPAPQEEGTRDLPRPVAALDLETAAVASPRHVPTSPESSPARRVLASPLVPRSPRSLAGSPSPSPRATPRPAEPPAAASPRTRSPYESTSAQVGKTAAAAAADIDDSKPVLSAGSAEPEHGGETTTTPESEQHETTSEEADSSTTPLAEVALSGEAVPTPSGGGGETLEAVDEATKLLAKESELTKNEDEEEPEAEYNAEPLVPAPKQPSEPAQQPAAQQEAAQEDSTGEIYVAAKPTSNREPVAAAPVVEAVLPPEDAGQEAAQEESTGEIDVAAEPAPAQEPVAAAPVVEAAPPAAAEQLEEEEEEEGATSSTSVETGVAPPEADDQLAGSAIASPTTEPEEPKGNLLSAALSGAPTPSASLTHLTRGRPASMNNRKRPTSSRRAKALGITVGPQTKEVIEPPRAMEESSAEEPNSSGEEELRRPDPLANRPSLMPGRIRSSPDMALELRGALFARGASSPQPLRLPSPVRMSLPTIAIPPTTPNDETKSEKAAEEAAAAPLVSPKRGLKGLLFGGRNADSKKSPRAKSPRKTKTIDGLLSPGKESKADS